MPTITHALTGGLISLLLYTYFQLQNSNQRNKINTTEIENNHDSSFSSKKSFNKEHVILFSLNSFVGPDYPKFLSPFLGPEYRESQTFIILHNNFSHTILGWCVWSIIFALMYYAIFRYATKARKTGQIPISLFHCYLIILGAGIFHFSLDILDDGVRLFPAVFGNDTVVSIDSFKTGYSLAEGPLWNSMSWFGDAYLLILGVLFLIILIWMLYHSTLKQIWVVGLFFFLLIYGLMWLVGSNIVKNENDFGFLFYVALFWVSPVVLCFLSMEELKS